MTETQAVNGFIKLYTSIGNEVNHGKEMGLDSDRYV